MRAPDGSGARGRCFMNGRRLAIAALISLVGAAPALAGELSSPAFTPRQMAHCMMQRLRANNAESFRDAFKGCKTQFESVRSERPADSAVTADTMPEKKQ